MIEQPITTDIKICDGIFIKSVLVQAKHTIIPQHSHTYAHVSMLAVGTFRVWKDNVKLGDFVAPHALLIEANAFHRFLTLTDNAQFFCIHNIKDAEEVDIHAEHELTDEDMAQVGESLSCHSP